MSSSEHLFTMLCSPDEHAGEQPGPGQVAGAHVDGAEEVHEEVLVHAGAGPRHVIRVHVGRHVLGLGL